MLAIVARLTFLLYALMMVIASMNLGITVQKQQWSQTDVSTIRVAFDRMSQLSMSQIITRVLVNIANGLEPASTDFIANRYDTYVGLQKQRIETLS